jgi:hypothetical protein
MLLLCLLVGLSGGLPWPPSGDGGSRGRFEGEGDADGEGEGAGEDGEAVGATVLWDGVGMKGT